MTGQTKMLFTLMGMKHCGKSTLGKKAAARMNVPFFDLDDIILRLYNSRSTGPVEEISVREVYKETGKRGFLELEAEGARQIAVSLAPEKVPDEGSAISGVCSLGGGTIENSRAMKQLSKHGLFCYIREDAEVLFDRIISRGIPAFLDPADPWEDFLRLYSRRTALYEGKADINLEAGGRGIDDIFEDLITAIKEVRHGR